MNSEKELKKYIKLANQRSIVMARIKEQQDSFSSSPFDIAALKEQLFRVEFAERQIKIGEINKLDTSNMMFKPRKRAR